MSTMNPPSPPSIHSLPKLPNFHDWITLSDAGLTFPKPPRRNDPVLIKIDNLVLALNHATDDAVRNYLYSILWFTTGYWHNHLRDNPRMEKARKPAIMGLLLLAQNKLGTALGCPGGAGLAAKLTQIYGKNMDTHGHICDFGEKGEKYYLTEAERDKFRIVFKDRLAHRFAFRETGPAQKALSLLDTKSGGYGMQGAPNDDEEEKGWAYFVMSMSSEIYMGPHTKGQVRRPDGTVVYAGFHSSYMAGKAVQCGGTMRVANGVVTGVQNDSGHYKPVDDSLAKVLELLNTVGMDLGKIEVRTVGAGTKVKGDLFLRKNGNWDAIRRETCEQMYKDFSSGKKYLHQLVSEYFEKECKAMRECIPPQVPDPNKIWPAAYRAVCWDLALFDAKWKAAAEKTPPPRTAPPRPLTAHPSIGVKKV